MSLEVARERLQAALVEEQLASQAHERTRGTALESSSARRLRRARERAAMSEAALRAMEWPHAGMNAR